MKQTTATSDIARPTVKMERTGDELKLVLGGDWSLKSPERLRAEAVLADLEREPGVKLIRCATSEVRSWDSSLLVFLWEVEEWCKNRQLKFAEDDLPKEISSLLNLATSVPEQQTGRGSTARHSLFYQLGSWVLGKIDMLNAAFEFTGECVLSFQRILSRRGKVDWRLYWLTLQECSAEALPIVGMISFLTGLILAFVGAIQLRQFGAGIYVANLVAVAMAREMGAIMTGIIMAGRTGAAFAAQIGSMKVSEEIDALSTLAISPIDFLVSPRVVALFLMMPLLCLYSDLIGIAGGAVVGAALLKISLVQYWNQTLGSMGLTDIVIGVVKCSIFGAIIALTGCQRGMKCENNAAAVGNAATSAVVLAITWIVGSDAIIDVLIEVLKI
ncbi:MAG: phospholipid/cholesterol/gamma-HCH transport system permease protein [Verrucomicrobiota bacterium]|jgi:phospholipid/cholesterol/gamma-HCH transport system permease protein